jgi:hypothetical protein
MIPLTQTKFGGVEGNCLPTCVASILEINIEDVPNFVTLEGDWWEHFHDFMISKGYKPFHMNGDEITPKGYHIACGMADRGFHHACVTLDGKVVHDPHPDRTGLHSILHHYVLVPILYSKPYLA